MKKYPVIIILVSFMLLSFCSTQDVKESMRRGKLVYEKTCLACHQKNGEGVPGMNPPLKKTPQVLGDKIKLIKIIANGTNEGITINGETFDNPMPAQPQLSNQEIADVLTYVRNSFGNKAGAITEAEVAAVRKK
jgi:mono/diheme cytochrome c family protein